jgi:hypothetical protein
VSTVNSVVETGKKGHQINYKTEKYRSWVSEFVSTTCKRLRPKDPEFEGLLGYIAKPCLKKFKR